MRKLALAKAYDPKKVEEKWYQYWLRGGYFHAEVDPDRTPFVIVIPPPNVTGQLHLGHALDNTLQDILIRWRRMRGDNAVWIPGTDHAGIATQIRVEEELAKEGKTRHDLGREAFLARVWAWKEKFGSRIIQQLQRLGASCDWARERFTMDAGCSRAVREVFVELYRKGLIYQGDYMINWCPRCHTALSDIEVEHEEREGHLWYLRYPLADGGGGLEIATTRPETMLGDTAVAVHPEDPRYAGFVGKELILPLVGRRIPVIADTYVDPEFGTGAVKVTPAHDPNDLAMGERHHLPQVVVIDEEGKMTAAAGAYAGMDRYACRRQLIADLETAGALVRVEEHRHAVGECSRCGTVVEPLISKQWFVKMKPLAEPALAAVREGRIRFVPERFAKLYLNWVENVRDWCISRQLWWGHRLPVWYCQDCGEVIVSKEDPTTCPQCRGERLEQDPDVLDTWFSSALWPFSTLGWPEQTPELAHFYPTSVLVTGFDIIYFWVARMIFMGLEFMGEVPFREVYIHGLVRDAEGRKMSKSLGNGIDPLEVIEEFGADTLRFSLVTGTAPGNDMRFYREKIEGSRNFANKLWNAARFTLMHLEDFQPPAAAGEGEEPAWEGLNLSVADRWIVSRFHGTIQAVDQALARFELGEGARLLYDFIWSELCDWYLELAKPALYGKLEPAARTAAQTTLWYVLKGTLALLHPYMPFLTEEIWQQLPHTGETLVLAPWPRAGARDTAAEAEVARLMGVIRAIRNLRAEYAVPPGRAIPACLVGEATAVAPLAAAEIHLRNLAGVGEITYLEPEAARPEKAATALAGGVEIYLPLAGLVDLDEERARVEKDLAAARAEVARLEKLLANPNFIQRAPATVVAREREKEAAARERIASLKARLETLAGGIG